MKNTLAVSLAALILAPFAFSQDSLEDAYDQTAALVAPAPAPCAAVAEIRFERWQMGPGGVSYGFFPKGNEFRGWKVAHGSDRSGAQDHSYDASLTADQYGELLKAANSPAFFALNGPYRDPRLADGTSLVTSVICQDGSRKIISDSNGAGPAALKAIETRLLTLADALFWVD